ncbi:pyrokinin-1 receptor-like [Ctenocephalides felis]|uniref:pyrokinin-1 receptor-like n=1 Tax=Ctenocephalides felis TaxID=7515 RepID=UPI000E6E2EDC|nr:pyrokinin-1 receptor-like [Ctenocephalides felis]
MSAFTNLTLDPNATLSYFLSHKLVRDLTQRLLLWNQTQNASLFLDNQTLSDLYQATKEGNAYGRGSISIVITITVIYLIIFLTGIVGNISTCVVISKNKSMHTVTNYYLFSLAVSDLLLLISGVPLEVHKLWYPYRFGFGEHVCIIQGLFAETSANATVLTITAFTIERYVAICHPFLSHAASSKLSRAIRYIAVIWLLALGLAIPQAMQFGVVLEYNGMTQCTFKREVVEYAFEVSGFVFFVGPMTVITVLYACIGVKLRRSRLVRSDNGGNASTNSGKNSLNKFRVNGSQTKVIRMLEYRNLLQRSKELLFLNGLLRNEFFFVER